MRGQRTEHCSLWQIKYVQDVLQCARTADGYMTASTNQKQHSNQQH